MSHPLCLSLFCWLGLNVHVLRMAEAGPFTTMGNIAPPWLLSDKLYDLLTPAKSEFPLHLRYDTFWYLLQEWTWANFRRWWGTGRPGMLQSIRSERVGHDFATEQQQQNPYWCHVHLYFLKIFSRFNFHILKQVTMKQVIFLSKLHKLYNYIKWLTMSLFCKE